MVYDTMSGRMKPNGLFGVNDQMSDLGTQETGSHTFVRQQEEFLDRKQVVKSKRAYWIGRRAQDIVLSLLALVVLAVPMLLTALVIFLDDPHGSPIFCQDRVGRNGKLFKFYKFRSMYVDAERRLDEVLKDNEMDGPVFKMRNDPRITRVGRVIRKTGLDELPQLVNILKGEMSIVGPRPALPREKAQYSAYDEQRLMVTPGLTCYWQIQPNRNDLSFDEWMALDLKYIRERSFLVDWKIIFGTVGAVLRHDGE